MEFPAFLRDLESFPGKWKNELNVDVSTPCSVVPPVDSEIYTGLSHSPFSGVPSCSGPLPSLSSCSPEWLGVQELVGENSPDLRDPAALGNQESSLVQQMPREG